MGHRDSLASANRNPQNLIWGYPQDLTDLDIWMGLREDHSPKERIVPTGAMAFVRLICR